MSVCRPFGFMVPHFHANIQILQFFPVYDILFLLAVGLCGTVLFLRSIIQFQSCSVLDGLHGVLVFSGKL